MEKKDTSYKFPSLKFYNKNAINNSDKQYEPNEFSINVIGGGWGRTKMQVMKWGVGQVVMQI